jgi:hypothetical protein
MGVCGCVCVRVWVPRASVFGIATRYGLDAPRIESRWGTRLFASVHTGRGPNPSSYTVGTDSFLGVKRRVVALTTQPATSAEVKERLEMYLYPYFGFRGLL